MLVYNPERYVEFGQWLDEQLVQQLLIPTVKKSGRSVVPLHEIAAKLCAPIEGDIANIEDEAGWHLAGAESTASGVVRNIPGVGKMLDALSNTIKFETTLRKLARKLRANLKLTGKPGAEDFCAAVILLRTAYQAHAAEWLASKTPPEELNWGTKSEFACRTLLLHAMRQTDLSLVICFDQLEDFYSGGPGDATMSALYELMRSSLKLAKDHANLAVIISTVPGSDAAIKNLHDSDRDRLREDPEPQDLDYVSLDSAAAFLEPRIAFLTKAAGTECPLLRRFIADIPKVCSAPTVTARELLRYVQSFGLAARENVGADNYDVLVQAVLQRHAPLNSTTPLALTTDRVTSDVALHAREFEELESRWQHLIAEPLSGARLLPQTDAEIATLLNWGFSIAGEAMSGVTSIEALDDRASTPCLRRMYSARLSGTKSMSIGLYLANKPNSGANLTSQLDEILGDSFSGRKVALRTRTAFPVGATTKIGAYREKFGSANGAMVSIATSELIVLRRLRKLSQQIDEKAFRRWLPSQGTTLPFLRAIVYDT
ncbi:MAG: hypothetical protein ABL932_10340 [Terricaulis sp.]